MPQIRRSAIVDAVVATLSAIGGTGYYNALSGHVFRRFREANKVGVGEFPVVFVLHMPDTPDGCDNDEQTLRVGLKLFVFGIVREDSSGDLTVTTAAAAADDLLDDIVKALLGNLKLNGKINAPLLLSAPQASGGIDPVYGYCSVEVTCPYDFAAGNLGPAP